MNWIIPPDETPGASSEACLQHLLALIESLGEKTRALYRQHIPILKESDLHDPNHPFAPMLIEHVRDVYYAHSDTGAWADIGFRVTG